MRQAVLILVVLAVLVLFGCGGGKSSSSSSNTPASVVLSPSTVSLNQTTVTGLTASVLDSSGAAATNAKAVAFTTSNAAVATVHPTTGSVCAGVWDANYVVCAPGQVGTATITATSGDIKGTATIYVHQKVDRVTVTTPTSVCKSVGQTLQLAAAAFSNGVDITSTVGPFSWGANNTEVATVDSAGLLTAKTPGTSSVFAGISNVASPPVTYTTCAVRSIHVHLASSTDTAFTLATAGTTQQLSADVVDTAGNTITPPLTWVSSHPLVATVSTSGLVTAVAPGTVSVVPECAQNCNLGLAPVYGDVAVGTVSGSSATTTVYVTGTDTTSLVPIDTSTNAAGTAITLPSKPNSLVFLRNGLRALLGSTGGLITLDATANTVTQNTAIPGKVLAVSPDSTYALVADTSSVYAVNLGSAGTISLAIAGATAATVSPDSSHAYILAGSNFYSYALGSTAQSFALAAPANDVAVAPSAAFAFLAGGATHSIQARATCDNSPVSSFTTPGTPTKIAVTPDAAKALATDSPNIDIVTRTSLAQPGCPPPLTASATSVDLGQGAFVANQMLLSPDGAKAYIASDLPKIIVFDVTAGTASAISLANGATGLAESITLDSAKLYVGGSDSNVHLLSGGADAQQIAVPFAPNLVAVRPK
jgi:hypothetical protein